MYNLNFNWWFVVGPLMLVLVAVISGLRHHRYHCRPLRARYNDRLPQLVGVIATITFMVLVFSESYNGLIQLCDNTLSTSDSPVWSLVLAGLALICGALGYYGLTQGALRFGDHCGRQLIRRRCRIYRNRCRHSIAAAQSCPMQNYRGCPIGVKFSRFSLEYSPSLMSSLRSQTDRAGFLDVPYIIKVEHPSGKVAYSTLLPHGQLQPLMQERRLKPQPRRLPNWLLDETPTPAQSTTPATATSGAVRAAQSRVVFTEAGVVQQETADGKRVVSMAARRLVVTNDPKNETLFGGLRQIGD